MSGTVVPMSSLSRAPPPSAFLPDARGLDDEESLRERKYVNMFTQMDIDGDGEVSCDELCGGIKKLGIKKSRLQVQQLLKQFNEGQPMMKKEPFVKLAKHLEYEMLFDVGADGELSPLERMMMKYDTDKSGEFSVSEVKAIVDDLGKERAKGESMQRVILGLVATLILVVGTLLIIVTSANELSKENHTDQDSHALVTKSGDTVATQQVESFASLDQLRFADMDQLGKLTQISLPMTWVDPLPASAPASFASLAGTEADSTFNIAGYLLLEDHLVLLLDWGDDMDVHISESEVVVRHAGETVAAVETFDSDSRRLRAAESGPMDLFSSMEEMMAEQQRRTGRSLGRCKTCVGGVRVRRALTTNKSSNRPLFGGHEVDTRLSPG